MTTFAILWAHDGARELEVHVDADLPRYGPLENRVRSIAEVAGSHAGLRLLLDNALGATYDVSVWETVGGVTAVKLARRVRPTSSGGRMDPRQPPATRDWRRP